MRLLYYRDDGSLALIKFVQDDKVPRYATLSHTWLNESEEVHYHDVLNQTYQHKPGYAKIKLCGQRAANDGLRYFWVDTCCIDRSSSQEVQEAVTSMYQWYHNAAKCYAHLVDVSAEDPQDDCSPSMLPWEDAFRASRWFTRGWTLQELLAPGHVEFFSAEGKELGNKSSLQQIIHEVTSIPHEALRGGSLAQFSISERLSWATDRQTTRKEDKAYSLLAIVGVYMPLMYGEGDHAISRLHEEIDKQYAEGAKLLENLPISTSAAFNSRENQYGPTCLCDTRVELLQDITAWAEGSDDRCIYWLNGIAGTGKSTIARTIARKYHDRRSLGGSFFFSRGGGDASRADQLFTTLASQLASKIPALSRHITQVLMEHRDIANQALRDQWEQLIINPLTRLESGSCPSAIVLVLDALDECDSERDIRIIMRLLAMTTVLKSCRLRIFITSRPEIPIRCGFQQIPESERQGFVLHDISPTLIDRDLTLFFEDNFTSIREERGFPTAWPGVQVITRLVEISGGLFIWASTACRYIRDGGQLAMKRISKLISRINSGAGPEKQLDQIYITVLREAVRSNYNDEEKAELHERLRQVLGALVLLSSPLSLESLATLLDIDSDLVTHTLSDLHTIFHIPSKPDLPIRLHHPAFRDFLLDKSRCSDLDFWIDAKRAHRALADSSVSLMSSSLKMDMCCLGTPGVLLKNIKNSVVQHYIPAELQYACLYWAEHYRQSGTRLQDDDSVHRLFSEHFLHWLETMRLLNTGSKLGGVMRIYQSLMQPTNNVRQLSLVKAARRFIAFQSNMDEAPLQIYCAALAFVRPSNAIRQHFWKQLYPWLKHVQVVQADAPETKDEYDCVNDLAFTTDGRHLVSGSVEPWAKLWNVADRSAVRRYGCQTDKVSSIAISPDGRTLASGSDDATIALWDLSAHTASHILKGHTNWINAIAFSADGKTLASGSMDETIRLWDVLTGRQVAVFEANGNCVNSVSFSPDGRFMVAGTVDLTILLWDLKKGTICATFDGHLGPVNSVQFSRDGKQFVSGSDDTSVKLWSTHTSSELMTLQGHSKKVWSVCFSRDSNVIASGSGDKTVRLWSCSTGDNVATLQSFSSGVNAVVYSPDDRYIATSSFNAEVKLWDARTGEIRGMFAKFEDSDVYGSVIAKIGAMSLTEKSGDPFSDDNAVDEGTTKAHAGAVTSLAFSTDGKMIASGSIDAILKIWTPEGREQQRLRGHTAGINSLAFSSNNRLLASASADGTAILWNTGPGSMLYTLNGHVGSVRVVKFSPDGRLLASCSTDKTVILWSTSTGERMKVLEGHKDTVNNITFSHDSRLLASCSADTTICVWDVDAGELVHEPIRAHDDAVNAITFSPHGHLLASGSSDKKVRIWDKAGMTRGTFLGHTQSVNAIAFSPDMKRVASCSDDKSVRVWDLKSRTGNTTLDVGVVLRHVAFSRCGRYLETDRGPLDTGAEAKDYPSLSLLGPHAAFITEDWVKRDMEEALWLPEEFQACSIATWNGTTVLGHTSGALSFINF